MGGKYMGWDDKDKTEMTSESGANGLFLKMTQGNRYKVRLVGKALHYYQFWEPIICRSPYKDEDGNVICPFIQATGEKPKDRFSIWVIDREDEQIKLWDFPITLFNAFKDWHKATNEDPGGMNGPDWSIEVKPPAPKQKYIRYSATALGATPFTEAEIVKIKAGELKDKMAVIRKDHTPDEIRELMAEAGVAVAKESTKKSEEPGPKTEETEKTEKASSSKSLDSDLSF